MKNFSLLTVSFYFLTNHIVFGQFTKLLDFEGASNGSRPWGPGWRASYFQTRAGKILL